MRDFWNGFEKKAQEEGRSWLAPTLGAAAAGLGAYGLLRAGPKTRLVKTLMQDKPRSGLGRLGQRLMHGADEIVYTPTLVGAKYPKNPKRVSGTVLHENPDDIRRVVGDRNIGSISKQMQKGFDDKLLESQLLNKVSPKAHMKTREGRNLRSLESGMRGDYLLKDRGGFASGVGGGGFLRRSDVQSQLAGKKLTRKKKALMDRYKKDPSKFIQQEAIDIQKGSISGAPREMRVHVIDGQVVPGASLPRGKNIEDFFSTGQAEAAMRAAVKKMPASQKKNLTMAADVAMTPSGPKIIELNRGAHQSGLLDPNYLWETYKGNPVMGAGAAAAATKANQAIYKHMTGRSSELSAGLKGLGAGLGTGALIRSQQRE